MSDRALIATAAVAITVLTVLLVAGHGPWAGGPLIGLGSDHGLNVGDVPVVAAWAAGMAACVTLWRRG